MGRPRLIQGLRIAISALSATFCVVLVAIWVRSYFHSDTAMRPTQTRLIRVESRQGQIALVSERRLLPARHWIRFAKPVIEENRAFWKTLVPRQKYLGFRFAWNAREVGIVMPLWFPVLITIVVSVLPWIHWSKRFGLRALLIVTTIFALLIGLFVALGRR